MCRFPKNIPALSFFTAVLLLSVISATAQTFTVDGNYLDKKGNPISGAFVRYVRDGLTLDSVYTTQSGYFLFEVIYTGTGERQNNAGGTRISLTPNPFHGRASIYVAVSQPGILRIFTPGGTLIAKAALPAAGTYLLRWGGAKAGPGIYLITVTAGDSRRVQKALYLGAEALVH